MHVIVSHLRPLCFALVSLVVKIYSLLGQPQVHFRYSLIGEKAIEFWAQIPQHFPFVELDEYILMPDHIHGNLKSRISQ